MRASPRLARILVPLLVLAACGREPREPRVSGFSAQDPGTVLFLGTSLTAGQGVAEDESYPALVQRRIEQAGLPFRVVNAGVPGQSAQGALRRLDELLRRPFAVLVLEVGANDLLRRAPATETAVTLDSIIARVRRERPDARIVLVGVAPQGIASALFGRGYADMYRDVAERHDLSLVPNLLTGVAGQPAFNLPDNLHPNPTGHQRLAATVWKALEPILRGEE